MNTMAGDFKLCCNQPPRLFSGEGFGYALMCMECGRGIHSNFKASTYQGVQHLWDNRSQQISGPRSQGNISTMAEFLLKELNDAHDVLRNLAFVLGAGGYNATHVDAKVFEKKIHAGIDMLTKPLLDQIDTLRKEKEALQGRLVVEEKPTQNKDAIVAEMTFEGCSYAFKKNGMVDVVILKSGRGFTRHINSVGLSVQQALEKQLSEKGV